MPWLIQMREGRHCIYKEGQGGEPEGESLGCHDSRSAAESQLRALYASESTSEMIAIHSIGEFRGEFPGVPTADGVNLDELRETDDSPFFVTLPVIPEIGAVSKSGLLYDNALAERVVEQINRKRPGARFGHLKEEDRGSAFPIPEGLWVGAKVHEGRVWAKAYVPPGPARRYIKQLRAVGGHLGTSIYGTGSYEAVKPGVRRTPDFELETLDFAPPERAALGYGATPIVTAEMNTTPTGDNDMPTKDEVIAELRAGDVPDTLKQAIIQEYEQNTGQQRRISELETEVKDRDTIIAELKTEADKRRIAEFETALDDQIAELTNWETKTDEAKGKVDALRRMVKQAVLAEMGDERDTKAIKETVESIWAEYKTIAETVRDALAGPAAIVNGRMRGTSGRRQLDVTPEATAAARSQWGI